MRVSGGGVEPTHPLHKHAALIKVILSVTHYVSESITSEKGEQLSANDSVSA